MGITSDKILRGIGGEYLAAGELSIRGYIASITLRNTKGVDILASNIGASKTVGIQVKTTSERQKEHPIWLLNEKCENYQSDNLFYVFVWMQNDTDRPEFYIVPSKDVVEQTSKYHIEYCEERGKDPKKYPMRKFNDKDKKYLEQWNLLGLDEDS
jgi:hypothetical protein